MWICEFSKYFYICPKNKWNELTKKFIRKLPEPFNHEVIELFNKLSFGSI